MVKKSLSDLRNDYWGGGADAELAKLQAFVDAGIDATDVLEVAEAYANDTLSTTSHLHTGTYAPRTGLYLPGVAGNYVSTPDDASLDITGDLDLRLRGVLQAPASSDAFINKGSTDTTRSYLFGSLVDGALVFNISQDGSAVVQFQSNNGDVVVGQDYEYRATLDADNGAGGHVVTFYRRPAGAGAWTTLKQLTGAGTLSVFSGSSTVQVGDRTDLAGGRPLTGRVYRAQVYNGIDGTLVADYRADTPMGPRYRDSTGKVWTINGSAWSWMVA